jgi:hemoglobin
MSEADPAIRPQLPFERVGGREAIARMVNRFYDLMDAEPAYAGLRAMHAPDLSPMRESLTDFLMAWMGGPRDWFERRPGACIMSAHRRLPGISMATATQWVLAMKQAAEETLPDDPEFTASMMSALAGICRAMAANAGGEDSH